MFHETHFIEDVFLDLTNSNLHDGRDTQIHHELIGTSKSKTFNRMVKQTLDIIRPQGNMETINNFKRGSNPGGVPPKVF